MSAHRGLWTLWPEEWNVGKRKAAAALSDARKVNMQFAKKRKDRETKRPNGRTDEKADEHLPLGIPPSVAVCFFPGARGIMAYTGHRHGLLGLWLDCTCHKILEDKMKIGL